MSWIHEREYVDQFQYGYPEWDAMMSDFTGIGRSDRGRELARREYEAVLRQSVHPPRDTVTTVDIYPVNEEGTEVETRLIPFHIRRGSLTVVQILEGRSTMRVDPEVLGASVDQMIAGITVAQTRVLTPTQYWELRGQLMTHREEARRRNPRLGVRGPVTQAEERRHRYVFYDGRLTSLNQDGTPNAQSQSMELRGEFQVSNGQERLPDAQVDGGTAEKPETEEDLTIVEYGPDKGTTELWKGLGKKRRIVAMTVDGIYYNKHADEGEPGYSHAPSAQPLFQIKEGTQGEGFIYDEFGYVNGDEVLWDSPFRWSSNDEPMGSMFDLKYDELVDDKTVGMYC